MWPLIVFAVSAVVGRRVASPRVQRRRFQTALVAVCVVLGIASLFRMVGLFQSGSGADRVYYGTDTRAFIVLIGATLGAFSAGIPTVKRQLRGVVAVVGTCCAIALVVVMASITTESSWLYSGGYGLLALLMVTVLLGSASRSIRSWCIPRDFGKTEKDIHLKIDFDKAFAFVRFLWHVDNGN